MKLDAQGWPIIDAPEPMTADELEKILTMLGEVYGSKRQLPARVLADALCMTSDRQISRWRQGATIPSHHVKTLRLYRAHGRLY